MAQQDILESWLALEREVAACMDLGPGPGVASADQIAGLSGLEIMQGMLHGQIPYAAIARTLDFQLLDVGPGYAMFQGTPQSRHLNPMGTVHGGWYATLLDSAMACAAHTTVPANHGYTTTELSIKLLRPLTLKVPRVRAEGKVLHSGRKLAITEARLYDPDGKLYAHATSSCLIL